MTLLHPGGHLLEPDKHELESSALELIHSHHVLTLSTCSDNVPWSAPLYYIFKHSCFYFFSNPESHHMVDISLNNRCAASVHTRSTGWKDIRGLQMTGVVKPAGISPESASAFISYLNKFNFISEMDKMTESVTNIESLEKAFKVTWYKFNPETIYYLDNSIRFGYREVICL